MADGKSAALPDGTGGVPLPDGKWLAAREVALVRGGAMVLGGVSLTLAPGEVLGIVGPNGAGKSTLLRCLAGVLAPTAGDIRLEGLPLAGYSRRELARRVAYSPQELEDRLGFTVLEAALMGRHPWLPRFGAPGPADRALALAALEALDMAHLAGRAVTELSGGEKRRAALARALTQQGRVLLLDEPTAGLDIRHALAAMRLFREAAAGRAATAAEAAGPGTGKPNTAGPGAAVAVVLHDLNLAAMYCHRLVMLAAGRVAAYGPTSRVLTAATIAEVFGVQARVEALDGPPRVTYLEA